jgi:hypothetical protein
VARKQKNPVTPEHKAYFMKRVKHHQRILNLDNWRIEEASTAASVGCLASVRVCSEDHLAIVALSADWGDTALTPEALDSAALHETLHIFLTAYKEAVLSEDETRTTTEEHAIIVLLEKLLATPKELL